ncbi:11255_t:CDS:2 [Paraglomus occultum]|uniref:11255_t:CDS:1 n=1 Tax=Paraglomus occultum TaxID=144539 RepID=A0A9N8W4G0_9GLOM|nr:11255_t:CDS:2 [Paraglomus occultum]
MAQNLFENFPSEILDSIVELVVSEYDSYSHEFHSVSLRKRDLLRIAYSCKCLCFPSLRKLWANIFDGSFHMPALEVLLISLPRDIKQSLGIYALVPETTFMNYCQYIRSVSLETLFSNIHRWLEKHQSRGSLIYNTLEMRREVARELLRQFKTCTKPLEKLRCVGFHQNPTWIINYQLVLEPEFTQWISKITILVIRGAFNSAVLINGLARNCRNIAKFVFSFYRFDTDSFTEIMQAALELINVQHKLKCLVWNGSHAVQGDDPSPVLEILPNHAGTLTCLRFEQMDFSHIQSLENLAACDNLESLTFEGCSNITYQAVQPMDQGLQRLREIKLLECQNFDPMETFARERGILVLPPGVTFYDT